MVNTITKEFRANREQSKELRALAYWIAQKEYTKERYSNDTEYIKMCQATIKVIFNMLDMFSIPYWVQNQIAAFASDWRLYQENYLKDYIKQYNIFIQ